MSTARAKGTRGENWLMESIRSIWPTVERAPLKGTQDKGDFVNCGGVVVEMKNTSRPNFLEWCRRTAAKATGHRWVVVWKPDLRTKDSRALAVVDLEFMLDLLQSHCGPFGDEVER